MEDGEEDCAHDNGFDHDGYDGCDSWDEESDEEASKQGVLGCRKKSVPGLKCYCMYVPMLSYAPIAPACFSSNFCFISK